MAAPEPEANPGSPRPPVPEPFFFRPPPGAPASPLTLAAMHSPVPPAPSPVASPAGLRGVAPRTPVPPGPRLAGALRAPTPTPKYGLRDRSQIRVSFRYEDELNNAPTPAPRNAPQDSSKPVATPPAAPPPPADSPVAAAQPATPPAAASPAGAAAAAAAAGGAAAAAAAAATPPPRKKKKTGGGLSFVLILCRKGAADQPEPTVAEQAAAVATAPGVAMTPIKRPRGRPRKYPLLPDGSSPKRPRKSRAQHPREAAGEGEEGEAGALGAHAAEEGAEHKEEEEEEEHEGEQEEQEDVCEYEQARRARIEANRRALLGLGVVDIGGPPEIVVEEPVAPPLVRREKRGRPRRTAPNVELAEKDRICTVDHREDRMSFFAALTVVSTGQVIRIGQTFTNAEGSLFFVTRIQCSSHNWYVYAIHRGPKSAEVDNKQMTCNLPVLHGMRPSENEGFARDAMAKFAQSSMTYYRVGKRCFDASLAASPEDREQAKNVLVEFLNANAIPYQLGPSIDPNAEPLPESDRPPHVAESVAALEASMLQHQRFRELAEADRICTAARAAYYLKVGIAESDKVITLGRSFSSSEGDLYHVIQIKTTSVSGSSSPCLAVQAYRRRRGEADIETRLITCPLDLLLDMQPADDDAFAGACRQLFAVSVRAKSYAKSCLAYATAPNEEMMEKAKEQLAADLREARIVYSLGPVITGVVEASDGAAEASGAEPAAADGAGAAAAPAAAADPSELSPAPAAGDAGAAKAKGEAEPAKAEASVTMATIAHKAEDEEQSDDNEEEEEEEEIKDDNPDDAEEEALKREAEEAAKAKAEAEAELWPTGKSDGGDEHGKDHEGHAAADHDDEGEEEEEEDDDDEDGDDDNEEEEEEEDDDDDDDDDEDKDKDKDDNDNGGEAEEDDESEESEESGEGSGDEAGTREGAPQDSAEAPPAKKARLDRPS
eukprot:m51a1_g23 hypothetical protein (945) ;mRNA; r:102262-105915